MKIFKLLSSICVSIGLGLVFLYSGYSKLDPLIEPFEFTFVEMGIANWYSAPVIARLLIGLEFFIGVLLILNYHLRRFTLPLTVGLLLFFIIYLLVQLALNGNDSNCGCFGERHYMSPLQAILKNLVMIVLAGIPYFLRVEWKWRYNGLLLSLLGTSLCLVPFILNPIDYSYTSNNLDEKVNYPLELHLLYHPEDSTKVEIPKVDLRQGRHVVAFLSLTCRHCRIAARKFRIIKKNNPSLSIYFVLNGDKKDYPDFISDTRADNIPSSYCLGKTFVQLASTQLPRIYYLDKGWVVKKVDYFELNQYHLENWLNTGQLE